MSQNVMITGAGKAVGLGFNMVQPLYENRVQSLMT